MAITCPRCGTEFDATLFEFDRVRCSCGAEIQYPGANLRAGYTVAGSAPPVGSFVLPESGSDGTGQRSAIRPPRPPVKNEIAAGIRVGTPSIRGFAGSAAAQEYHGRSRFWAIFTIRGMSSQFSLTWKSNIPTAMKSAPPRKA